MTDSDYVKALEEECARANVYIGLLRVAAIQGDKPHFASPDYTSYEQYRDARDHRFAVRAEHD